MGFPVVFFAILVNLFLIVLLGAQLDIGDVDDEDDTDISLAYLVCPCVIGVAVSILFLLSARMHLATITTVALPFAWLFPWLVVAARSGCKSRKLAFDRNVSV